jgi:hypothetical protein
MWNNWYVIHWWLDIPVHIAGGAFIGMLFYYLFFIRHDVFKTKNFATMILMGLGFVALAGVFWEFYEFFLDVYVLRTHPLLMEPGYILFDTLKDLVDDLVGGFVALTACHKIYIHKRTIRP